MEAFFRNADNYIAEVIKPLLPNADLDNFVMKRHSLFSSGLLSKSKYEFPVYEDQFFLHFTSVSSFLEIIRSKKIRVSDLNSFSDEFELTQATSNLVDNPDKFRDQFRGLKSSIFAFSMCEFTEDNIKSKYMWEKYGQEHKGICIKLKLDKSKSIFKTFHISKMSYTENEHIEELSKLKERHDNFIGDKISNIHEIIAVVASLYKYSNPYSNENEVRLIASIEKFRSSSLNLNPSYPIRHKFNKEKNLIENFFELELEYEYKDKHPCLGLPYLSIESIYIGRELIGDVLADIRDVSEHEFKESFKRDLKINFIYA